ncbi:hypothetical protein L7F22_057123 [Adiantum nelumboides]|nr:hypothetical protein [Adiantum nelumboides]
MEYSSLYGDVNQLSLRFERTEVSEVMVVHRMYVRLQELQFMNVGDRVKRLYVLADVVELPSIRIDIHLPATVSTIILCRVLYIPQILRVGSWCTLRFMRMGLRVVETSAGVAQCFALPSSDADVGDGAAARFNGLCIHADRFIYRQDTISTFTHVNPLQLFIPNGTCTFSTTIRPDWPETLQISSLSSLLSLAKGPHLTSSHSDLQRSDEIELLPSGQTQTLQMVFTLPGPGNIQSMMPRLENSTGFRFFPAPPPAVPADPLTDPSIILGLQMNMLSAELVLAAHNSLQVIKVVSKHVEWLNKILLQVASPTDDILALLFRVQAFIKMAKQSRFVVPRLQYRMYSSLINRMVQVAQNYDQEFRQLTLFIAQNEILGSYLLEQNKAFAEKEKDMSVFHSQVVSLRRSELQSTIEMMDRLSLQMERESEAMNEAKDDMVEAIQEYERKQLANALFAVLGAIASVALAFVTGGATAPGAVAAASAAVNAAGRLAAGLQKVVEILEGLQAVMEIVAAIRHLVESLENMGQLVEAPEMPEMPTNADWLIFVNEVEAVAEQVPEEVAEVPVWKAKCKNVAVLGQEMCITATYISELQYQIRVEEMLQEIAQRQADRLVGISATDLSSYTEMATQIDMRTTRMLLQLIKMLYIQNAAIKYEYLYAASEQLNSWPVSMQTVWTMLLQQETAALLGLLDLGPSNDFTVTYVVKDIPVKLLVDGYDWHFDIPVDDFASFPAGWSRVRIRYVELKFDQQGIGSNIVIHQPSTDTGLVYMLLQTSRFLADRKREEVMDYEASTGLAYAYAYDLNTGETTLSNIPTEAHANTFMQMTPFTAWSLRLSASAVENQGLVFPTATSPDKTTQISITFYVTAIRRMDTRQQGELE